MGIITITTLSAQICEGRSHVPLVTMEPGFGENLCASGWAIWNLQTEEISLFTTEGRVMLLLKNILGCAPHPVAVGMHVYALRSLFVNLHFPLSLWKKSDFKWFQGIPQVNPLGLLLGWPPFPVSISHHQDRYMFLLVGDSNLNLHGCHYYCEGGLPN